MSMLHRPFTDPVTPDGYRPIGTRRSGPPPWVPDLRCAASLARGLGRAKWVPDLAAAWHHRLLWHVARPGSRGPEIAGPRGKKLEA